MGGQTDAVTGEGGLRCGFGLALDTALGLPGRWRAVPGRLPVLRIIETDTAALDAVWSGRAADGWDGVADGRAFRVEHGAAGDLRMELADAASLHLSTAGDELLLATAPPEMLRALRFLLDSALFTVSLMRGYEALHAGAVALDGRLIAVTGRSGAGKSTLVQALLDAGGTFVSDDVLVLEQDGAAITGHPGPPVLTLPVSTPGPRGSRTIGTIGDEHWLAVDGARCALPLAAVVALEPPGPERPAWQQSLSRLLAFPRTPERERTRFALAAELARVPVMQVRAREAPAADIAAQLLDALGTGLLEVAT